MSHKLKGAHYRYDARNVEALAAQMALQTWHTLLLGQKFDIYSDHDSLQYLFTQKSPSQRILRLCEFLADFDFEEIKYVPGPHNVVPDFLSRPWDANQGQETPAIHVLASCTSRRVKPAMGPMTTPSVVVMPSWQGFIAVQEKHQRSGLWSVTITNTESSQEAACRAISGLTQDTRIAPKLTCVAHTNGISLWRAEFAGPVRPSSLTNPCSWVVPVDLPPRKSWYRPHFETLTHFGVWGCGHQSTIFKSDNSPSVGLQALCPLKTIPTSTVLPPVSALLQDIRTKTPEDAFLGDVLQAVTDSDDNFYRDFFLDDNRMLCFRRSEDVLARVCVPAICRERVLRSEHGDSLLAGHPGIDRTTASVAHSFYWPGLHADVAQFVRSCPTCAASKGSKQQRLGIPQFSAIPLQPFTSWAMELIGPLPTTQLGNNWIVTWVDRTTKTIVAAAAAAPTSKEFLARLTFREICCRFGLPLNLTMDNDVRFNNGLWKNLWTMCGSKLKFTSSYHPQADPAERANRQVMEALRAAVATVAQYEEWDLALPRITFGLNTHVSTATKLSPFEFAHGFPARVSLTFGQASPQRAQGDDLHLGAAAIANRMKMRHWAAADHMAAAQARLGHLLAKRSRPATLNVGDLVWMDSRHTPNNIPFKLTARWFGPFTVIQVKGAQATLDLPPTFGKTH